MWTSLSETILREFGEKASILRILHFRQVQSLTRWERWFLVPSLVASISAATITGTMDIELGHIRYTAAGLSFLAAACTSIKEHMRFAELAEAHRRAAGTYAKMYRQITTELAMAREQRSDARETLKAIRGQLDQIGEDAPVISRGVVNEFLATFDNQHDIALPEICNGLKRIRVRTTDTDQEVTSDSEDVPV
jgi:hypothetical protein